MFYLSTTQAKSLSILSSYNCLTQVDIQNIFFYKSNTTVLSYNLHDQITYKAIIKRCNKHHKPKYKLIFFLKEVIALALGVLILGADIVKMSNQSFPLQAFSFLRSFADLFFYNLFWFNNILKLNRISHIHLYLLHHKFT